VWHFGEGVKKQRKWKHETRQLFQASTVGNATPRSNLQKKNDQETKRKGACQLKRKEVNFGKPGNWKDGEKTAVGEGRLSRKGKLKQGKVLQKKRNQHQRMVSEKYVKKDGRRQVGLSLKDAARQVYEPQPTVGGGCCLFFLCWWGVEVLVFVFVGVGVVGGFCVVVLVMCGGFVGFGGGGCFLHKDGLEG